MSDTSSGTNQGTDAGASITTAAQPTSTAASASSTAVNPSDMNTGAVVVPVSKPMAVPTIALPNILERIFTWFDTHITAKKFVKFWLISGFAMVASAVMSDPANYVVALHDPKLWAMAFLAPLLAAAHNYTANNSLPLLGDVLVSPENK